MYVPLLNRMRNNIVDMGLEPERLYKAMMRFKELGDRGRIHLAGTDIPGAQAARAHGRQPAPPLPLVANSDGVGCRTATRSRC